MNWRKIALVVCLAFSFGNAFGQSIEKDPVAIVELGGATSWNVKGGAAIFAPDLAVEVTPIENWLELELGTTPFLAGTQQSGIPTCYSRSPGPSPQQRSSCLVLVRSGFTSGRTARQQTPWPLRSQATLCSGPPRSIGSAGISNRPTITVSGTGMSNPLA